MLINVVRVTSTTRETRLRSWGATARVTSQADVNVAMLSVDETLGQLTQNRETLLPTFYPCHERAGKTKHLTRRDTCYAFLTERETTVVMTHPRLRSIHVPGPMLGTASVRTEGLATPTP